MKPQKRWFRKPLAWTREEAIAHAKNSDSDGWHSLHDRIFKFMFKNQEQLANQMIKAREKKVEQIYLSLEDAKMLEIV